jgi:hypothetical protein
MQLDRACTSTAHVPALHQHKRKDYDTKARMTNCRMSHAVEWRAHYYTRDSAVQAREGCRRTRLLMRVLTFSRPITHVSVYQTLSNGYGFGTPLSHFIIFKALGHI